LKLPPSGERKSSTCEGGGGARESANGGKRPRRVIPGSARDGGTQSNLIGWPQVLQRQADGGLKTDEEFQMEENPELSEQEIQAVFERVIDKHLDALVPSLSAPEIPEVKQAYLWAFDLIFNQLRVADEYAGGLDSAAELEQATEEMVETMVAAGPADPKHLLRDWRLLVEMGALMGYVNGTARKVVKQKLQVTPEVREKLESTDRRLREVVATIRSDCPYLLDSSVELPASTLRLNRPRWALRRLGECRLDLDYILGRSEIMSLDLSHVYRAGQRS